MAFDDRFSANECSAIREMFDMSKEDVYLACASRAPLARRTFQVGMAAAAKKSQPWTLGSDGSEDRVRSAFAQLVNCSAADVAICQSTSFAITTAARAVSLNTRPGDVGIILEDQMSSNVYPWQYLQRTHGLVLKMVPYPHDGGDWTKGLLELLASLEAEKQRVAVVAIPVVLWTDGSGPIDVSAVCRACKDPSRSMTTAVVVDGTQSLGAFPFDVQQAPVDFLAASVHKWLFGAYGASCLFVARKWWEDSRLEPLVHDEHQKASAHADEDIPMDTSLPGYPMEGRAGASRLDGGGRPNPILLPMAAESLEMVLQWGPARIAATLSPLTDRIHERCTKELGLWVPPMHGPHFLGVGPGPRDCCRSFDQVAEWTREAASFLKRQRIYVSGKHKVLRVAPHVYTRMEDVDRFVEVLASFVKQWRASLPASRL